MELLIVDCRALGLETRYRSCLACLPTAERQRALRFRREEDRMRSAVGALLIEALRPRAQNAALRRGAFGKPYFAHPDAPEFSLSHAGALVVLATAPTPVGVDVERLAPVDWKTVSSVFSAEERGLLSRAADPLDAFYRVWTVREAFSKEEGLGLSIFERETAINYETGEIAYEGRTLYFRTFDHADHRISVCFRDGGERIVPRILSGADWDALTSGVQNNREGALGANGVRGRL